ncbi:hypothetical protein [Herbiconiux sp. VKM Ac-2851]|uniref:hypothetical protein n=1 Tax=Herbiconiux sp. VKM Ac-2851 TaxID=2739025 RepID=UPI001564C154|nr:hypothetical protein [Herbiconiux sp. VKM Ac-2851]NQX34371.1 hypothetical protein [Herbiconiux sp. VKM Ac-2851]
MTTIHRARAAALIGVVAVAALLAGCSGAGTAVPTTTVAAAPSTAAPSPTPTNPPAPVVRVPSSCDQLLPQPLAEAIADRPLEEQPVAQFANPVFYTDARVGALSCGWVDLNERETGVEPGVVIRIVPGVTEDDYDDYVSGEAWAGAPPAPEISDTAQGSCTNGVCGFTDRVGAYAVSLRAANSIGVAITETQKADSIDAVASIVAAAATWADPEPVWQPVGTTLTGATSCDGLIDPARLVQITGTELTEFKGEGGEYSNSSYRSAGQVGAWWCSWAVARSTDTAGVFAAVLPGGASYFAGSSAAEPDKGWSPIMDYPGEAYGTADGGEVAVLVDGGWVDVRGPGEVLPALVDEVLGNVGAVGG